MGIRQQLTELSNRPEGNTFEVWEEADGSITSTLGGKQVVVAETNPLTGGIVSLVVSNAAPSDADGRPDGTIYVQTV